MWKSERYGMSSSPSPLSLSTTSVQPTTVCRHPFSVVDHPPLAVVVHKWLHNHEKKTSLWKEEEKRIIKKWVLLCLSSLIFAIFSNYFSLIKLSFPLNIILKLTVTFLNLVVFFLHFIANYSNLTFWVGFSYILTATVVENWTTARKLVAGDSEWWMVGWTKERKRRRWRNAPIFHYFPFDQLYFILLKYKALNTWHSLFCQRHLLLAPQRHRSAT